MALRLLSRVARQTSFTRPSVATTRTFASESDAGAVKVDLTSCYETHRFDVGALEQIEVPTEAYTTKEELIEYFVTMHKMRRMEIICDENYKDKNIRGFCHLYDGQEATATGVNAAFTNEDCWITSYRCHCVALARGGSVAEVLGELFGKHEGMTKGKGGSMHFYKKSHNFYGGQGIVGAQVPVGAGLAFACKYQTKSGEMMPVAAAFFGDGAANQGQIWESANMSALWKLPLILVAENNQYGMGTSIERHSSNQEYYTMGNKIPGIKMDGNNVFAVREGMALCKEYCGSGHGPMYVEMDTYRYHGHSMSDPGIGYRDRKEVQGVRAARDPIDYVKKLLIEHNFLTEKEVKELALKVKKEVDAEAQMAQEKFNLPPPEELYADIYTDGKGGSEMPPFVRMPDIKASIGAHPF